MDAPGALLRPTLDPTLDYTERHPSRERATTMTTTTPLVTTDIVPLNGQKVRWWRRERGFSQQDLATRAMISRTYVAEIERGAKQPRRLVASSIAASLQVRLDQLL